MPKTKKLYLLLIVGFLIIQAAACNSSSDSSASDAEIELTLQAIYAERCCTPKLVPLANV